MYQGERFNALSHLVGAILALAGAIVLVVLASIGGDPWKVVGVSIYGMTLVVMYSSSTLYHSVRGGAKTSCARWIIRASTCSLPAATHRSAW